jgi:hypothetical protein
MTAQRLKQLVKESIEEVFEESSCAFCGESVYETETKCNCVKEESDLAKYKDALQQKLSQLK